MEKKVAKIENISTLFNVLAWFSLIVCISMAVSSLINGFEEFYISCYFLGAYISCLCTQHFFYALYVIALRNLKELPKDKLNIDLENPEKIIESMTTKNE